MNDFYHVFSAFFKFSRVFSVFLNFFLQRFYVRGKKRNVFRKEFIVDSRRSDCTTEINQHYGLAAFSRDFLSSFYLKDTSCLTEVTYGPFTRTLHCASLRCAGRND